MERRITKKIDSHQVEFKNSIKEWITKSKGFALVDEKVLGEFMRYIYDYPSLKLEKTDFQKRRRVTNTVPLFERCNAIIAGGEQCTRRKKQNCKFCGTHCNKQPHGVINNEGKSIPQMKKVEVWVEIIKGIHYYIDANHNVYMPGDIISGSTKPRIIGKWKKNADGVYDIPDL
tara:strand:- start:27 stop:545 length:519 start_codon:yes stop_codon:yes gene_type:complete